MFPSQLFDYIHDDDDNDCMNVKLNKLPKKVLAESRVFSRDPEESRRVPRFIFLCVEQIYVPKDISLLMHNNNF